MRLEQVRLTEDATQAHRLQNLLGFKEQFISKTVAAQVIGTSGSDFSRIVYIDKGERAGIRPDMAVITADGIVGKVLLVGPNEARVLLISDQSSGVGAILEKSRLQGVLRGTPDGEVVLERVMSDETVQPGETVLTSGGDQIFPKGLRLGTVTKVSTGKDLFLSINIRPAANLGKLEEVLVLTEKQERQAVAEDQVRVRAADILAQRLPSVPDKPPTDATGTALNGATKPAGVSTPPKPNSTGATTAATGIKTAKVANPAHPTITTGQTDKATSQNPAGEKPKPPESPSTQAKQPLEGQPPTQQPSVVEQKPAPVSVPPDSPPPPSDNSPQ
jgi:rod shape-determining protein MreC